MSASDEDYSPAASAAHWRRLAKEERERLIWDKYLLPQIAEARAQLFEQVAESLDYERRTGVPHCGCTGKQIPFKECANQALKAKMR